MFSPLLLPVLLNRLRKWMDGANAGLLRRHGLGRLHLLYLLALHERAEGMTLRELSDLLGFDKANTSRAVARLMELNYAAKDARDGLDLKYRVALTEKGRAAAAAILGRNMEAISSLLRLFTPEELAALACVAGKLQRFLGEENCGEETGE